MPDQLKKWELPELVHTDQYKCVVLRIPDKPEYITAFYEAYDMLCRWLSWEKRGDTSAREAGLLFRTYQPVWLDCEIADAIDQETGDMAINLTVNTTCNCCCSGTTIPVPVDQNGNPFPVIPLDPTDPFGDDVPTWDEPTQTPPPGYDDWQSYLDDRCRAANWFVDSFVQFVENADLVERQLSIGTAVLEVVALIIAFLPGPLGDWAGVAVITKWVLRMASLLATTTEELEDLNDWLQTSSETIEENRQELVCGIYRMTSIEWFREFFLTFFAGYIDPALEQDGASDAIVNFMRDLFAPLAENLAERAANGFANQQIPEDYLANIDCGTCQSFVPNIIRVVGAASGTPVLPYTWAYAGPFFRSVNDVVINQLGDEAPAWLQAIESDISFFQSVVDGWHLELNSRTQTAVARLQGQLTSSSQIAALTLTGCYANQGGFSRWHARITTLDGTVILDDATMDTPTGFSPTQKTVNLPDVYPAGTVFDVQLTSSSGWSEIMAEGFFQPDPAIFT